MPTWFVGRDSWTVLQLGSTRATRSLLRRHRPKEPAGRYHAIDPDASDKALCGGPTGRLQLWDEGFGPDRYGHPAVCPDCARIARDRYPAVVDRERTQRHLTGRGTPAHRVLQLLAEGGWTRHRLPLGPLVEYGLVTDGRPPRLTPEGMRLLDSLGSYQRR